MTLSRHERPHAAGRRGDPSRCSRRRSRRSSDPRIGFVTVTGVETTSDLARRPLGQRPRQREAADGDARSARRRPPGLLQARVGARATSATNTPQLVFAYDPAVEHGVRMTQTDRRARPCRRGTPMTTTDDSTRLWPLSAQHERFLVTSHENPDGDALGSLLATHLALRQLGKDSVMVLIGERRCRASIGSSSSRSAGSDESCPADHAERVLVAVDCAQESRLGPDPRLLEDAPLTIDIDHHHDNTAFGDVNLIVPDASSTGEVLADVFAALGVEARRPRSRRRSTSALVTDTGRFQYTNTTPKALRLAADLVEAGAQASHGLPARVRVGRVPEAQASRTRARACAAVRRRSSVVSYPRFVTTSPRSERSSRTPRGSSTTCAPSRACSSLRSSESRHTAGRPHARSRCDRRSTTSTSLRSRASRAAAATVRRPDSRAISRSTRSASSSSTSSSRRLPARPARSPEQMAIPKGLDPTGMILVDKPAGPVVVRDRRSTSGGARARRPAMPGTLDPFATGLLLLLSGRATKLAQRFVRTRQALRDGDRPHVAYDDR